jgi:hypothetical protein
MADVFALRNSAFNPFLHATVGIEPNGSGLTILSVLARLDRDPWVEAASWSQTSKDAAIDALARTILLTQLSQPSDESARSIAARLIELLPRHTRSAEVRAVIASETPSVAVRDFLWVVIGCVWLYAAIAIGMGFSAKSHPTTTDPGAPAAATSQSATIDPGR